MTDERAGQAVLTYGKHKGKQLADVPAEYLLWLTVQCCKSIGGNVKPYGRINDEQELRQQLQLTRDIIDTYLQTHSER